ncbi:type II CRISPR-associated endonuclease Cas1 [Hydrogenimonas sp.]
MAAWKTIRVTKPCTLRIENGNLLLEGDEMRARFHLGDVDSIVFEGDRFTLSARAIAAFSRYKVAVLFCDERYMPSAILHPYHQSSLAAEILKKQLAMSENFRDAVWLKIVETKILLQKSVAERFGRSLPKLADYAAHLRPKDPYRAEAKSARLYWSAMLDDFKRERDSLDVRNQALNYAYAVLRSLVTRDLAAAGFVPALGLCHDNRYNAFNLSDDLMEPLRPIVDAALFLLMPRYRDDDFLSPPFKREILGIFDMEYLRYRDGLSSLRTTSKRYIESFKKSVSTSNLSEFECPDIDFERLDERI